MGHGHEHSTAAFRERGRLTLVLGITLCILTAEVVGGVLAHSLVLIADAGHMMADAAGIGLSLLAVSFAARPASDTRTFGYQRAEILAAVVNAVFLFAVSAYILVEAVRHLLHPQNVTPGVMVIFGVVAMAGNASSLLLLRRGHDESLNVHGAFLEVLSDLLGATAILLAAAIIAATGYQEADAWASLGIGVLILPRTAKLLRDAVDVLLESAPRNVDLAQVRSHMCETPGVLSVHDLHAWTITSGIPVLSAHVVVSDASLAEGGGARLLDRLGECLVGHFDVEHCTFQLEPASHRGHETSVHP